MSSRSTKTRGERFGLAGILLLALVVRGWFGHFDPTPQRFFDEQFALENVGSLLMTGSVVPANGYHPSLSYLPQVIVLGGLHALAEWTDQRELRPLGPGERIGRGANRPAYYPFTPLAYLLGRWTQALLGTAAVALTYLLGRRLGGARTGLVAAALAAVTPQLVRQSSLINEDAALVLTVLVAVLAAARAGAAPSWRSYLLAGAAVGLACSSKFNGVAAAIPLLVITAVRPRDARGWVRLGGAGLAAVAVFLLLNPFVLVRPQIYATDFGRTVVHYGKKAAVQEGSHLGVLVSAGKAALDPAFLGPLTGALALLGLGLLLWHAATAAAVEIRYAALAIVAYAAGYPTLYAVATRGVSRHNWLPLLPLLLVAVAYLLSEATRLLDARWRSTRSPDQRSANPGRLMAVTIALLAMLSPAGITYRWATPRTLDSAGDRLAENLANLEGRVVLVEEGLRPFVVANASGRAAVVTLASGELGDPRRWSSTDGLVMRRNRQTPGLEPTPPPAEAKWTAEIESRFAALRGPALRVHAWRWSTAGEPEELRFQCVERRRWVATSEHAAAGTVASLSFWLPQQRSPERVEIAGQEARLHWVREARNRVLFYSEKVVTPPPPANYVVELEMACGPRQVLAARLLRWRLL